MEKVECERRENMTKFTSATKHPVAAGCSVAVAVAVCGTLPQLVFSALARNGVVTHTHTHIGTHTHTQCPGHSVSLLCVLLLFGCGFGFVALLSGWLDTLSLSSLLYSLPPLNPLSTPPAQF